MNEETENQLPNNEQIINEFESSPEYKIKQTEQEEKLGDDEFDVQQGYGYPEPTVKENLFTFWKWFFDIVERIKLNKTGNLETHELNNVRLYEDFALYNKIEGQPLIAKYLNDKSSIVLSTSLSKKGFGAGLVGTQVRKVQRMTTGQRTSKGMFSKNQTQEVSESE